jgi:hypothetical protein
MEGKEKERIKEARRRWLFQSIDITKGKRVEGEMKKRKEGNPLVVV